MFSKRSVAIGWVCSYFIILFIPIITIFINYFSNVQVIKKEIIHANELVLENLQECMDNLIEDQLACYHSVFLSDTFDHMVTNKNVDEQFYYDANKMVAEMTRILKYDSGLFVSCFLVDKNYVLDSVGGNRSDYFYRSMVYQYPISISYDEWMAVMTEKYDDQFLIGKFIHRNTSELCLVYADTLGKHTNIFVGIPVSKIANLFKLNSYQFILSIDDQDVLYLVDGKESDFPENMVYGWEEEIMINNESYVCLHRKSANANITYKLLIPSREFWKEAQHTQRTLLVSMAATLILGAICVVLLLRHNMAPLTKLLLKIGGEINKGNEYRQMEVAWEDLNIKISSQDEMIRKNQLLALLKGRNIHITQQNNLIELEEKENMGLVSLEIPLSDKHLIQHDELLYFVIDNIFSELMEGEKFYRMEDGQYLFYLFVIPGEKKEIWKQKCQDKMDYLCQLMKEKWGVSLESVISGVFVRKIEDVKFLYRDIMKNFEWENTVGEEAVSDTGITASVKKYVAENYSDSNLNITTMANELGWTPKYISKVFREKTQKSILDYITEIRIEKAIDFLGTGDYSIEEISQKVGYSSSKTFRRIFANKTGVAPSKYKINRKR